MRRTLLITALAASLSVPALAGGTPIAPPAAKGAPVAAAPEGKHEAKRAEVQQKIQAFLTGELSSRLSLDATKSAKLADAIKAHMERKQARMKTLKESM